LGEKLPLKKKIVEIGLYQKKKKAKLFRRIFAPPFPFVPIK